MTLWRGIRADYSRTERDIISPLPVHEQWILHSLKARFGGEIQPAKIARSLEPEPTPEHIASGRAGSLQDHSLASHGSNRPAGRLAVVDSAAITSRPGSSDPVGDSGLTSKVYIDAEDIPFGEYPPDPKKPSVRPPKCSYRLEWTNGAPTLHKTKKVATRRMRAWVQWKRRQGFQVITHPTGYFAGKDSVREAVQIREVPK